MSEVTGILRQELYPLGFSFVDPHCKLIAEYIGTELNELFLVSAQGNVVNTIKAFNDVFLPLTDYPVLKVYKLNESIVDPLSNIFRTNFNIVYSVAYNLSSKTTDLGAVIGKEIARLVHVLSFRDGLQLDHGSAVSVDYDEMIDLENAVYSYVTVNCTFLTGPIC